MSRQMYEPVPAKPRPLGLAVLDLPYLYIRGLFPSSRFFAQEGERGSWGIVWVQILLLIIIPGALGLLRGLSRSAAIGNATNSQALYNTLVSFAIGTSLAGTLILTLIVPILFFIGVGIQFALAKAFGGNGRFVGQCYAQLLYQVPLTILTSIISTLFVLFVQFTTRLVISPVVSLALFIYGVLLNVMVIAGVHNMTRGKATAVVLIPYIVGALLACGLALYFAKLIISALHNVQ
jgi:Yip1 domain